MIEAKPYTLVLPQTGGKTAQVFFGIRPGHSSGADTCVIVWEPGNSKKYRALFTPLPSEVVRAAGFSFEPIANECTWLVTSINPGQPCTSYMFSNGTDTLHYLYVFEKLCHKTGSHVDASELTRLIAVWLRCRAVIVTDECGRLLNIERTIEREEQPWPKTMASPKP
jgi:hypothetical protein